MFMRWGSMSWNERPDSVKRGTEANLAMLLQEDSQYSTSTTTTIKIYTSSIWSLKLRCQRCCTFAWYFWSVCRLQDLDSHMLYIIYASTLCTLLHTVAHCCTLCLLLAEQRMRRSYWGSYRSNLSILQNNVSEHQGPDNPLSLIQQTLLLRDQSAQKCWPHVQYLERALEEVESSQNDWVVQCIGSCAGWSTHIRSMEAQPVAGHIWEFNSPDLWCRQSVSR